jgi:N-formylglutamate amidohydrolase
MHMMLPIVLHIPHASTHIPATEKSLFIVSDEELQRELDLMTDHFTDWLLAPISVPDENKVVAPVSRLLVDMERFENDEDEIMSKAGMGAVYTHGSQRQLIKRDVSDKERAKLIEFWYRPHHLALENCIEQMLTQYDQAIMIDVHSYPSKPLPYELNSEQARPDICIGTCQFHTPNKLVQALISAFEKRGFNVGVNTPFSGTLVPSKYWLQDQRVVSFMLEVRRDIYMDESQVVLKKEASFVQTQICDAIQTAFAYYFSVSV